MCYCDGHFTSRPTCVTVTDTLPADLHVLLWRTLHLKTYMCYCDGHFTWRPTCVTVTGTLPADLRVLLWRTLHLKTYVCYCDGHFTWRPTCVTVTDTLPEDLRVLLWRTLHLKTYVCYCDGHFTCRPTCVTVTDTLPADLHVLLWRTLYLQTYVCYCARLERNSLNIYRENNISHQGCKEKRNTFLKHYQRECARIVTLYVHFLACYTIQHVVWHKMSPLKTGTVSYVLTPRGTWTGKG
jgi:hypothetical protein